MKGFDKKYKAKPTEDSGIVVRGKQVLVQLLCVDEHGAVLLQRHKKGPLKGLSTGLIVPVEDGETPEAAARREFFCGPGWTRGPLERGAVFTFIDADGTVTVEHEFVARTGASAAQPAGWRWVGRDDLDFAAMPADDAHWYGRVLDGEKLVGQFVFGPGKNV